jgi:hypothetical protein
MNARQLPPMECAQSQGRDNVAGQEQTHSHDIVLPTPETVGTPPAVPTEMMQTRARAESAIAGQDAPIQRHNADNPRNCWNQVRGLANERP